MCRRQHTMKAEIKNSSTDPILTARVAGQCHTAAALRSGNAAANIVQEFRWPQSQSGRVWRSHTLLPPPEVEPLTVLPVLNIFLQILF